MRPSNVRRRRSAGMTLMEVMIALAVLLLMIGGILATFLQSRRLAASSIAQNCAVTIVQGYVEQLKNIPLQQFVNALVTDPQDNPQITTSFTLPTLKDQSGTIQLTTTPSTVDPTPMLTGDIGVTPANVVDNLQSFDMDSRSTAGTTTWQTIWPHARNYPSTTPGVNDLRMNFWVQITDLTPTSTAKCKAYGILIVYTYQFTDGGKVRYARDAVRTIRSAVQTF